MNGNPAAMPGRGATHPAQKSLGVAPGSSHAFDFPVSEGPVDRGCRQTPDCLVFFWIDARGYRLKPCNGSATITFPHAAKQHGKVMPQTLVAGTRGQRLTRLAAAMEGARLSPRPIRLTPAFDWQSIGFALRDQDRRQI